MPVPFLGRDALVAAQGAGPERRLLTWTVDTAPGRDGADVIGDEPVWYDGDVVGWITSGGYSHHMDTSVAMGYVPAGLAGASGDSRSRSSASDMPLRSSTAVSGTPKANE
ncbi:MAG: hypothetical protein HKN24_04195 [Acidimicrobiales bacterium]|nr:hypothetical protein [Acidimicrobiales bacterium]